MTSQQAIILLKNLEQSLDDYCELNDEGKAAFRMAITALEKFGDSERLPSAQPEKRTEERTETHACDLEAELVNTGDKTSKSYWALQAALMVASSLPPAQPEQQWIPCSEENLPDAYIHIVYDDSDWFESDCVVIQDKEGHFEVCRMCADRSGRIAFCVEGSVATEYDVSDVIAWLSLPAPYQGEGEE